MRPGAKVLFDDVSTAFTPRKRIGLTGPNEAGETPSFGHPQAFLPDEAANCLDLESISALNIALQRYTRHGAASHPRSPACNCLRDV
jgi:ATPase subunit of ABC transporter with duplicated ATPase domains